MHQYGKGVQGNQGSRRQHVSQGGRMRVSSTGQRSCLPSSCAGACGCFSMCRLAAATGPQAQPGCSQHNHVEMSKCSSGRWRQHQLPHIRRACRAKLPSWSCVTCSAGRNASAAVGQRRPGRRGQPQADVAWWLACPMRLQAPPHHSCLPRALKAAATLLTIPSAAPRTFARSPSRSMRGACSANSACISCRQHRAERRRIRSTPEPARAVRSDRRTHPAVRWTSALAWHASKAPQPPVA